MSAPFVCERTVVPVVLERRDVHTVVIVVVLYLVSWKRYKTFDDMRPRVINPTAFSLGNSRSEYYQLSSDSVSLSLLLSVCFINQKGKERAEALPPSARYQMCPSPFFSHFYFRGENLSRTTQQSWTNERTEGKRRERIARPFLLIELVFKVCLMSRRRRRRWRRQRSLVRFFLL